MTARGMYFWIDSNIVFRYRFTGKFIFIREFVLNISNYDSGAPGFSRAKAYHLLNIVLAEFPSALGPTHYSLFKNKLFFTIENILIRLN